jgi:hypothetical protein
VDQLALPGGVVARIVVRGEDSDGRFCLLTGVLHDGAAVGDEPVRRVLVFSPAGMERFFKRLSAVEDPAAALALAQQHGWRSNRGG